MAKNLLKVFSLAAVMLAATSAFAEEGTDTIVTIPQCGVLGMCPSQNFMTKASGLSICKTNSSNTASRTDITYYEKALSDTSVVIGGAVMLIGTPGEYTLTFTEASATQDVNIPSSNTESAYGKVGETVTLKVKKGRQLYKLVDTEEEPYFAAIAEGNNLEGKKAIEVSVEGGKYYMTLTSTAITNIKNNTGNDYSEKITWTKPASGIEKIYVNADALRSGRIFNLAGQSVDEDYKGIVIIDGKKLLKK